MLSIILYGRNDSHGYNYHKRLAISMNCLAELLSDPDDEILFTDYNTANDLPTILEAIEDTLTDKAKMHLRIFRVRPHHHLSIAAKSPLPLVEPIARNVALRRMNPANQWVLSTNIDMIFVVKDAKQTFTELLSTLKGRYYTLPRLEIPESLWEMTFHRMKPLQTIDFLKNYASKLHLNTIMRIDGFLQYDNPGDFQLMRKEDLFEIQGFDERMLKGWHVDANLARRMHSKGYTGHSIEQYLNGYHCNHTQKQTLLHHPNRTENNWHEFVAKDGISPILEYKDWGLAKENLEEIRLTGSKLQYHLDHIQQSLKNSLPTTYDLTRTFATYNHFYYSPSRVFTYLVDHLCHLPKHSKIAYIGYNNTLIETLRAYLQGTDHELIYNRPISEMIASCSLFIFDFGIDPETSFGKELLKNHKGFTKGRKHLQKISKTFLHIVKKIKPMTKCIGIHVKHSDFNLIFSKHLSIHLNSYVTDICYGYKPSKKPRSLLLQIHRLQKKHILFYCGYYVARYMFSCSDFIARWVKRCVK